ncbi:MAG TPA: hypothetical protein VFY99_09205 [Solirubrobacterales bacterium]
MRATTFFLGVLVALAVGVTATASAAWTGDSPGDAYAAATSIESGKTPTVAVSGRNVAVNWSASSVAGGPQATSYVVKRYDGAGQEQAIGAGCSGDVSSTSCTEHAVPAGTWRYTVRPKYSSWTGAESAESSQATVGAPSLSVSPNTVSSLPQALSGQIQNFITGQSVTFRLDDPTSGQVLTGSITPSPVPNNGTANLSVTLPSGVSNGNHTIYALGNQGDQASANVTVSVAQPVTINTSAWDLRDASSGTAVNRSDATAFDDNLVFPTDAGFTNANFNNAFATNRYYQWDYSSPLPAGLSTSNVSFDFRFRSNAGAEVGCFYFDVISAGNVIGTHGSTTPGTASSQWCTDSTEKLVSTTLPEVTSTSIANGLRIKVYGYESGKKPIFVDQATVSGTAEGKPFTLYETSGVNAADTSPQTLPWSLAAEDGVFFVNDTNWQSAFGSTLTPQRYTQLSFPSYVPSSATIDSVSFEHRYQASSGSTICYYLDAWSGAALPPSGAIGTYPNPPGTNGVSCAAGTGSWVKDSVSMPQVDTPAEVNGLVLRLYYRTSAGGATKTREDFANLKITYH